MRKLLNSYGFEELLDSQNVSQNLYKQIKKRVHLVFEENFIEKIQNLQDNPKLRTYSLVKRSFAPEKFLSLAIPKYVVSLCRLRTSSHLLEIERGRYNVPKTPVECRICRQCTSSSVEDEKHFIITCEKYAVNCTKCGTLLSYLCTECTSMSP